MNFTQLIARIKNNAILITLLALGIIFRFYTIHDNNVFFYFDQSRDATVSRQIIEQGDIKIQGPSASGTNDSLYHGVLYYYIIGPLYTLFAGSPIAVAGALGILGSITIITIYKLTLEISENKTTAIIAASLTAVSAHASLSATWLSNPQLALLTIPLLYFYLWKLIKTDNLKSLPLVGLFLGLSNQSIIFSVYLFVPVALVCIYIIKRCGLNKVLKPLIITALVYLATISTMLLAQIQLARSGIFKLTDLTGGGGGINLTKSLDNISQVYTELMHWAIFPSAPAISLVATLVILVIAALLTKTKVRLFMLLWLSAPVALLIFQPRNSGHTLMGVLPVIYITAALVAKKLSEIPYGKQILATFLVVFVVSNTIAVNTVHKTARHPMVIQFGATIKHQLQAIDDTYSKNSNFSIATLTVPYKINTTWGYLYDWYGQQKYNKKPTFSGSNQTGLPGDKYLSEQATTTPLHASIIEPLQGIPESAQIEFADTEQANQGKIIEQKNFGAITVQYRQK